MFSQGESCIIVCNAWLSLMAFVTVEILKRTDKNHSTPKRKKNCV
jgi:hypothetical protein